MPLHRIKSLTLGVPGVEAAARFYEDFGLRRTAASTFATIDGGDQLELVHTPTRRLVRAVLGADDPDDIGRIVRSLEHIRIPAIVADDGRGCRTAEPVTGVQVRIDVDPRVPQPTVPAPLYNGPGRVLRLNARADGVVRTERVRPRRLGHFVLGTTDFSTTRAFFVEGLGFRVSDIIKDVGVFLRCSTDHHNVLVQRAPVPFLHHTSWQVDDVDEIGRGATSMLTADPQRHVWGLGRHYAGSNFFWYLKDPAGNFAEYHSDMDSIPDDAVWTPETLEGAQGLFQWGPPPPPSFLAPEDLAELMIAGHR